MAAGDHEIHDTPQNTREEKKTSVWLHCSECSVKKSLKAAQPTLPCYLHLVSQSNSIPAGGCGLSRAISLRVRVARRELAEALEIRQAGQVNLTPAQGGQQC